MLSLHFEYLLTAFDLFGNTDHLHKELHSRILSRRESVASRSLASWRLK
jgi:hypothetical protein